MYSVLSLACVATTCLAQNEKPRLDDPALPPSVAAQHGYPASITQLGAQHGRPSMKGFVLITQIWWPSKEDPVKMLSMNDPA